MIYHIPNSLIKKILLEFQIKYYMITKEGIKKMSLINSLNYCPGCGTKIIPDANFCMDCGYNLGELREIISQADKITTFPKTQETVDYEESTGTDNELKDYQQEVNKQQQLSTDADIDENEPSTEENNISDAVNDIELVRPDYNENNKVRQPYIENVNQSDDGSIKIKIENHDDSNDFDIVRPNSQKNNKKESKDFSILNQYKNN